MLSEVLTSRRIRRGVSGLLLTTMAALAACAKDSGDLGTGPNLPGDPPSNPQLSQAAFILDVNTQMRKVTISQPSVKVTAAAANLGKDHPSLRVDGGPSFSVLAGDVINLTTSNYFASAVGAVTPGKVTVRFDVNITNRLGSVQLITPTFPTPPAGVPGLFLFPFSTNVTTTSGGVSVGGDGTDVIIDLPNVGQVAPSTDWNGDGSAGSGSPFNFFNDTGCPAGSNDCYRWEAFAQPLAAGATSESRTVGFDIDPTVSNFRARIIVAADLQNSGPTPTGTVAGNVTSPQRGALSGVTVTVTSGGFTGTTDGAGAYSIASVTTGPKTVALSGLPSGCTNPGSQNTTVSSGGTSTVNFSVVCTAATGNVTGSITRSGPATPSLAGVIATATPGASGTSTSSATLGSANPSSYTITGVQVGSGAGAGNGSVALSSLPAGCTAAPVSGTYTGLTLGGTVTGPSFNVDCQTPPSFYQYAATWGTPSGGTVSLTLTFDPTTRQDAGVNGASADDIAQFQATIAYPTSRLTFVDCVNASTGANGFTNINANETSPGQISLLNFKNGNGATAPVTLGVCHFTVNAGSASLVTTSTTFTVVAPDGNGDTVSDLIPNTNKTEASATF